MAAAESSDRVTPDPRRREWPPYLLLVLAVFTATLLLARRALGDLLAQVQLASGASFGGMEELASGWSLDFVARTRALLSVWGLAAAASESTRHLIVWTVVVYTALDTLFLIVYATLLIGLWSRLWRQPTPAQPVSRAGWNRLRWLAHWRFWWVLPAAAAFLDVVENVMRLLLVLLALDGRPVSGWLIWPSWVATTVKFVLLLSCMAMLALLVRDTGLVLRWWRPGRWALWRVRLAIVVIVAYVALLFADPTGQAVDLARRWVDDGFGTAAGTLAMASSMLLGLAVWTMSRRVVLSDQKPDRAGGSSNGGDRVGGGRWWWVRPAAVAAVAGVAAAVSGWRELFAITVVAVSVLVLGLLWKARRLPPRWWKAMARVAAVKRREDAAPPADDNAPAVRGITRALAIASPVALLVLTAVAYAPVLLVLPLSGQATTARFAAASVFAAVGVVGAPLVALGGWMLLQHLDGEPDRTLRDPEVRYVVSVVVIGLACVAALAAAFGHARVVNGFVVVPVFLAIVLLLLGEAQRWSQTHRAPPGLLVLGATRLPVTALLVITLAVSAYGFTDGSAHAAHRTGATPPGLVDPAGVRQGISLDAAFAEWVSGNCAGAGHSAQTVPLVLVAAPGGGLRAAYWTASTLTDLFGATRDARVPDCATAAPADRIFAMGGASGGSLGVVAYLAGLDPADGQPRTDTWYDAQLARPDFLTDPLAWMLTVDLVRGYAGFGGPDRARRLEQRWQHHITGLGDDFLTGTWGAGGHRPIPVLTGTQAETGCRLNISGLRTTDAATRAAGGSCTTLRRGAALADAPITSDLLDYLCGPDSGSPPASLQNATAALLSARFPYISPSGQLYRCSAPGPTAGNPSSPGKAVRTSVVDGGYADNTGIAMLLALWPRLERLIAVHNTTPGNATVVPVFLEVDNHYARVAAPAEPGHTVELLVPPSTRDRPDRLDDRALEAQAAATFSGPIPGQLRACNLTSDQGRFVRIGPRTSPGLPAPLAWTLSQLATDDLRAQRQKALTEPAPTTLKSWTTRADGTRCQ